MGKKFNNCECLFTFLFLENCYSKFYFSVGYNFFDE